MPHSRVFIGNLPPDASQLEVENFCKKYGALKDVWIARNPPGFGFVVYEDARDAEDAVQNLNGKSCCGNEVKVEFAREPGDKASFSTRGRSRSDTKCYSCGHTGHFARDCDRNDSRRRRRHSSSSRSSSPRRTRRRSPSYGRSDSGSPKRKRRSSSGSPPRRSRSNDRKRTSSKKYSRSRSSSSSSR